MTDPQPWLQWIGALGGAGAFIGVVLKIGGERQEQAELVKRMDKAEERITAAESIKTDMATVKSDVTSIKDMMLESQGRINQLFDHLLGGRRSGPLDHAPGRR